MLFSLAFKHFCLKKSKQEGIVQSYCPFLVGIKTGQALDYKIWQLKGKSNTQKKKLNITRTFSNEVFWGQSTTYAETHSAQARRQCNKDWSLDKKPFWSVYFKKKMNKSSFTNYVDKSLTFFDRLPPSVDIFYPINVDKKAIFLDYLPPSSCKRSLWTILN